MRAALVILDGWGLADHDRRDAVRAADTPNFDRLRDAGAFGTLTAWGRDVGLPDDQMGNSEVGHMNIGAGRTVYQEYTRINDAIEADEFVEGTAIGRAFDRAAASDGRVHLLGLVSDGGVHSDQAHLHALIDAAADRGVEAVTHAFTDGRDTAPKSGRDFLARLDAHAVDRGTGDAATVSGRYYAMDRDRNWERTKRAYDAIVNREADHAAPSAVAAVEDSYERGDTDEFVEPTTIDGEPGIEDGDGVVFFNFRADRARQLTRMLADIDPEPWEAEGIETSPPDAELVTMTEYDEEFGLPVAFPPTQPEDTLGEVLSGAGLTQLRMAESEKYAHVTYFLNGGREVEFDGEVRRIVESPDVPTYDETPEMSAVELTDTAIDVIDAEDPDVLVLNYANPDMVGHTGDFDAAVAAVEAVDRELGRLAEAVRAAGGHLLVTADHGNADDMGTPEDPHTAHTFAPVPFVSVTAESDAGGMRIREGGSLIDIAPTLLSLVGVARPESMTGESLLVER
ncbi:2,3-bisphosphoglycerate-independent phosphoglycerate mutase [Halobaculum sp. CBA1158]|uniref:2,3-bisphosphoglycerate-independent phosphoglycerate mutase n=1 Tax=Halobaculum sp. CBA1158 TaxID=2904243 RepID=UPI001F2BD299|nr:2,3-bisphosphoglycerate-independent phosphoglycerate mutase [Halobaculum sp. CBA1158]UIP00818.1 2,3-bisphosphoglycerate-independent phosphoglycerate mutase [Halobaculum sp. CBA1158]